MSIFSSWILKIVTETPENQLQMEKKDEVLSVEGGQEEEEEQSQSLSQSSDDFFPSQCRNRNLHTAYVGSYNNSAVAATPVKKKRKAETMDIDAVIAQTMWVKANKSILFYN